MCGRLANDLPPELIQRIFSTSNPLPNLRPSWNVAPTMDVAVVRLHPDSRERHLDLLRWGLVPFNTKDLKSARKPINARSETVASSPMFRAAFAKRRCIVPAAAFYEWRASPSGKKLWGVERSTRPFVARRLNILPPPERMEEKMTTPDDLSRARVRFDQDATLVAVLEMGMSGWLAAATVPGLERQPLKKLAPDADALLRLLHRWRDEAVAAGRDVYRIVLMYEAGRDGFWLARWLRARGVEAHVCHPTSIAVSREHKRAKTDRLDTALLMRALLGWIRGEPGHCRMVVVPTLAEEDARRPNREHEALAAEGTRIINRVRAALFRLGIRGFNPTLKGAAGKLDGLRTPEGEPIPPNTRREMNHELARLAFVREQMKDTAQARAAEIETSPRTPEHRMTRDLARIVGVGAETADMLVREVLSRDLRDRRAVARYAGLTGSPDESGARRRERGLAKAGSARVRRGMIELAWRFLQHQRDSELAAWFRSRVDGGKRKTAMIVALARKLLIMFWQLVHTGELPRGVRLHPAA
jgi:transposase